MDSETEAALYKDLGTVLVAYDPGQTTGYAYFLIPENAPMELRHASQVEGGALGFLNDAPMVDVDVVVCEQFVLDGRTTNPDLEPLRIEGILMSEAFALGHVLEFQRNNAKRHATNEKLKEIGWYQKGMPHANDAIRHALAWAKVNKHLPTLEAYFK